MADVANAVVVSKDLSELANSSVSSECSETNITKQGPPAVAFSEIDAFSDLSFKTGDDFSLQDIIESEFAARMSGLSAESSPNEAPHDTFDDIQEFINSEQNVTTAGEQKDLAANNDGQNGSLNLLDDVDVGMEPGPDVVGSVSDSGSGVASAQPDLVAFKCPRPSEMPIMSAFDPFARIEEDSEGSNSTPLSANNNVLNSPDEFSFPESPQNGQLADSEPMVDLFVKTISDENLDLSDPLANGLSRFNTSSVESVNNSFPNVSDLTSPDRADHEEMLSDDLISSEPMDTVVDQDEGTSSVSHHVDLSTEETENGMEDQSLNPGVNLNNIAPDLIIDAQQEGEINEAVTPKAELMHLMDVGCDVTTEQDLSQEAHDETADAEKYNNDLDVTDKSESEPLPEEAEDEDLISPVNKEEDGPNDSDTISPEDEKSLSISEKLESLHDDFAKPAKEASEEFAKQMAPIAAEEEDDWTTVEEALGGADDVQEEPALQQQVLASEEERAVEILEDVLAKVESAAAEISSPVLVMNVVTNPPNIVLIPAEDIQHSEEEISQTESDLSTSSEVRTTKKKKTTTSSSTEGSVKRTKKTKKSEEKENISVDECDQPEVPPAESLTLISHSASASDADDLLNVSVRDIMQTYCSEAAKSFDNKFLADDIIPSPVPIQNLKSSFSKFDQLSKKTIIHVRSVDSSRAQKQFSDASAGNEVSTNCKSCGKMVFQMEQVKAERAVWHKNCFRCKECNKQLTSDTYSSHEGVLYCKPHFKELFKPKAVIEDEEPPSDKPDLGLEELAALNVKSRFQVFEKGDESDEHERAEPVSVKRSPSILSKLAKFQKKGGEVGVTDDSLNGAPLDHSQSSSEEEDDDNDVNRKVVKSKKLRERPVSFANMEEVKSVWSNGVTKTKDELREERKQEIQQIRSRLFSGKQVKMKEAYEQAVRESEATNSPRKSVDTICSEKARSIKECFEKGEPLNVDDEANDGVDGRKNLSDDSEVFEAGISKKSRSLFLELDKTAQSQAPAGPKPAPRTPATPVKARVTELPEQEVYHDPNVVRAADRVEPDLIRSNTTAKMLSLFRQLEEKTEDVPDGPKPLKCFTPPPDYKEDEDQTEESEEESEEEYEEEDANINPDIIRSSDIVEDDYLKQAANAARAKQLRAKFERWEEKEVEREQAEVQERRVNGTTAAPVPDTSDSVEVTSIECTKSLRARFESMRTETEQSKEKVSRPKVNRFVEMQNNADSCEVCQSRVYPLERVETSGRIFHKSCFRCVQCNCLLRLETFTLNCGRLYCMPHFRQLFTVKGNYDEGFGADQHKAKWSRVATTC